MSKLLDLDAGEFLECLADDVYKDSRGNKWIVVSDNLISHEEWNETHEIMFVSDGFSIKKYYDLEYHGTEIYENYVRKIIPYSDFCSIFHVDVSDFWDEDYSEFIDMVIKKEDIHNLQYNYFLNICSYWEIKTDLDEEKFKEAKNRISSLGLLDFQRYKDAYCYNTID